jgi:hypothetical protein
LQEVHIVPNQRFLTKLGRELDQVALNCGILAEDPDVTPGRVSSIGGYTIATRQEGEVVPGGRRRRRRVVGGSGSGSGSGSESGHLC